MNRKALYALLLAIGLPLLGFFIMDRMRERNIRPLPHYIPDSVITRTERGQLTTDTVWHRMPDFRLVNQLGDTVTWNDLTGKVVVADFFFTHCPTICPGMTRNMKLLQESIKSSSKVGNREATFVQYLSFSVDPERDSVPELKKWADRFQVNPENWWLLTGDKKTIYDLGIEHMKLGMVDGEGIDTAFLHSDYFVLIDRNRNIRGYYHGLDTADLSRLSADIIYLTLEKDPGRPSFFADKLGIMVTAALVALMAVGLFFLFFRKKSAS